MRRHTSVLMLFARSSFYKVLGVLAAMTAAECGIFYLTLRNGAEEIARGAVGLEILIGLQAYMFVIGVIIIAFCLSKVSNSSESREEYTLRRLGVSEKTVILWQWAYNTVCFLFAWMIQALLALGLCFWYLQVVPAGLVNHQTVAVAFYTNEFLHRLIPLSDFWSWVLLLTIYPAVGLAAAWESHKQRHVGAGQSRSYWLLLWFTWLAHRRFWVSPTAFDIAIMALCMIVMVVLFIGVLKGGGDDEEKTEADA